MDKIPLEWAPVIAAAWLDDEFKAKLKYNPKLAFKDFDLTYSGPEQFTVPPVPSRNQAEKPSKSCMKIAIPNSCTISAYVTSDKVGIYNWDTSEIKSSKPKQGEDHQIYDRPMKDNKALNFDVISAV